MNGHGQEWELSYYTAENGRIPFREWFESLHDIKTRKAIDARLSRLRVGNFGQCAPVGNGVSELKIDYGPGYRIYFARSGEKIFLLLCGGNKSTQKKDVQIAHAYWKKFKED